MTRKVIFRLFAGPKIRLIPILFKLLPFNIGTQLPKEIFKSETLKASTMVKPIAAGLMLIFNWIFLKKKRRRRSVLQQFLNQTLKFNSTSFS